MTHRLWHIAYESNQAWAWIFFDKWVQEWSEFTAIIDILKKREQEKRKKNDKRKKAGKVKRAENLENKENDPVCTNGDFNGINGIPPSTSKAAEMEKTIENLSRTMMTLKSGESNKSVTSNKPGKSRTVYYYWVNKIFLVQKNRLIQACPIQVKDKSVQTSTDDNVLKQLEQKDKRISELEKSQLKAKKQIDKNSKLEKEISELRAINLRQSKELEGVKSMKKKHKVLLSTTEYDSYIGLRKWIFGIN